LFRVGGSFSFGIFFLIFIFSFLSAKNKRNLHNTTNQSRESILMLQKRKITPSELEKPEKKIRRDINSSLIWWVRSFVVFLFRFKTRGTNFKNF
jgi:hypothetical protein